MENYLDKVNLFMDTVAGYAKMNDDEKLSFKGEYLQGLLINLLVDGQSMVSSETLDKMKTISESTGSTQGEYEAVLGQYIGEIRNSSDGEEIINRRLREMIDSIIASVKDVLTEEQKDNLLGILV
jgi:hypothetical protein